MYFDAALIGKKRTVSVCSSIVILRNKLKFIHTTPLRLLKTLFYVSHSTTVGDLATALTDICYLVFSGHYGIKERGKSIHTTQCAVSINVLHFVLASAVQCHNTCHSTKNTSKKVALALEKLLKKRGSIFTPHVGKPRNERGGPILELGIEN